jgi:hypothetical protein
MRVLVDRSSVMGAMVDEYVERQREIWLEYFSAQKSKPKDTR